MIASEIISDSVPSVKSTDPVGLAVDWMNEFKLAQLVVVDQGRYKGLVTEDDLLDAEELTTLVRDLKHKYAGWESAYILENHHIYDAIALMSEFNLEIVPVLDEAGMYQGVVTLRDLMQQLSKLFAMREPGGILVLEIPRHSYVLSEIGRIAESADSKVLSLYLSNIPDSTDLLLTLKLNVEDLSRVVAAFERFDYKIVRTYHRSNSSDDVRKNFDNLLKYLDI
ncbi:MAG: CBS domain-containing protein [Bacteroidota bacterium]